MVQGAKKRKKALRTTPKTSAAALVEMFNLFHDDQPFEFRRIEELVEKINRVDDIARERHYAAPSRALMGILLSDIHKFLSQTELWGHPNLGWPGPDGWTRRVDPLTDSDSDSFPFTRGCTEWVLEAATKGYLRLVRRCAACGKWMVKMREIQKWCSTNCRVNAYDKRCRTEEDRRKNREAVRNHRERVREMEANHLEASRSRISFRPRKALSDAPIRALGAKSA